MALSRNRHDNNDALESELTYIDKSKEAAFTWNASRAPTAKDAGKVWIFRDGATLKMYLFDSTAGAWRGPATFS